MCHKLLRESDVLSIHIPLSPETRHYISSRELALLPNDAIVINTSRGPVVDEAALVAALEGGHLGGAGLDVFEEEPKIHAGLLSREDVVVSRIASVDGDRLLKHIYSLTRSAYAAFRLQRQERPGRFRIGALAERRDMGENWETDGCSEYS